MKMKTYIVRFVGDPTGYRIYLPEDNAPQWQGWITAFLGVTDKEVKIDIRKAYLIEDHTGR
jgi:hypothetical protein